MMFRQVFLNFQKTIYFACRTTLKIHIKKIHPEVVEDEKAEHSYFNKKDEPPPRPMKKKFAIPRPSISELRAARTAKFKEQMAHLRELKKEKIQQREQSCARTRNVDEWKKFAMKKDIKRKNKLKKLKKKQQKLLQSGRSIEEKPVEILPPEERPMRRERKAKRKAVAFIEEVNAATSGKITLGDYERPKYVTRSRTRTKSEESLPSGSRRSARMQSRYEAEYKDTDPESENENEKEQSREIELEEKDDDWDPENEEEPKKKSSQMTLKELTENFLGKKIHLPQQKKLKKPKPPPKPKKERKPKKITPEKPKRPYRKRKAPHYDEIFLTSYNITTALLDHNYCKMPEIPKLTIVEAPDVCEFAECTTSPEMKVPSKSSLRVPETSTFTPGSLDRSPRSQAPTSPFRTTLRSMLRHSLSQGQGFTKVSPGGSSEKYAHLRIKSGTVQQIDAEVDKLLAFVQTEIPNLENIDAIDKTLTETFGEQSTSNSQDSEGQLPDNFFPSDIGDLDDIVLNEADFKLLEKFNFDQGVSLPDIQHVQDESHGIPQPAASQSGGSISPQASKSIIDILKRYQSSVEQSSNHSDVRNSDIEHADNTSTNPDLVLPEISTQPEAKSTVPDIVIKVPNSNAEENLPLKAKMTGDTDVEEVASTLLSLGAGRSLLSPNIQQAVNKTSSDNAGSTVETTINLHNETEIQQSDIITEGSSVSQINAEVNEPSSSGAREEAMEVTKEETTDEGVDSNFIAKQAAQLISLLKTNFSSKPNTTEVLPEPSGPAVVVEQVTLPALSDTNANHLPVDMSTDAIEELVVSSESEVHSVMPSGSDFVLAQPSSVVITKELIEENAVILNSDESDTDDGHKNERDELNNVVEIETISNVSQSRSRNSYSGALTDHGYF